MKSILDRFGARLRYPVNDAVRWGARLATVRRQFVGLGRSTDAAIHSPVQLCISNACSHTLHTIVAFGFIQGVAVFRSVNFSVLVVVSSPSLYSYQRYT